MVRVWVRRTQKWETERTPRLTKSFLALGEFLPGVLHRFINDKLTCRCNKWFSNPDTGPAQIRAFVKAYGNQLDLSQVKLPLTGFRTMNDFFQRNLVTGARPVAGRSDPGIVVSPADCRLLTFSSVREAQQLWIKGRKFTLAKLLATRDRSVWKRFVGGSVVVARLAPQDFHRFHAPLSGVLSGLSQVPGAYYSVQPRTVKNPRTNVYTRNRRNVIFLDTEMCGKIAIVAVGAVCVGSIRMYRTRGRVRKGSQLGTFGYGGSTVVILFPKHRVQFDPDLLELSSQGVETLVRANEQIGVAVKS